MWHRAAHATTSAHFPPALLRKRHSQPPDAREPSLRLRAIMRRWRRAGEVFRIRYTSHCRLTFGTRRRNADLMRCGPVRCTSWSLARRILLIFTCAETLQIAVSLPSIPNIGQSGCRADFDGRGGVCRPSRSFKVLGQAERFCQTGGDPLKLAFVAPDKKLHGATVLENHIEIRHRSPAQ